MRAEDIVEGLDAVTASDPALAAALARVGYPGPRLRERGYRTLLRTIVGQQVSVAAASSMWRKLEALLGEDMPAEALLAAGFDDLRGCGLSRQKQGSARSLCELVVSGELDLDALPADDEEAIAQLVRIKGIGRILGLPERPSEKATRALADDWRPHRGAIAILTWHCYNIPAL